MKIGATKQLLITFNTAVLSDLDEPSVESIEAYLFVGQRVLLRFKRPAAGGFDGVIEKHASQPNCGIIRLTPTLSHRLIPGKLRMELWLAKLSEGISRHYDLTVDITHIEPALR